MNQGFKVIPFDACFADEINHICENFTIKKWQYVEAPTFLGKTPLVIVEYVERMELE